MYGMWNRGTSECGVVGPASLRGRRIKTLDRRNADVARPTVHLVMQTASASVDPITGIYAHNSALFPLWKSVLTTIDSE